MRRTNFSYFGCSCEAPIYEFGEPNEGQGAALWYGLGIPTGLLIVVCGEYARYFDILNDQESGAYYDGHYFILRLVIE